MTKTIKVSDETYEKIKEQLKEEEKMEWSSYEDLVGKKLFIRTVTFHWVGKVEKVNGSILQLSNASWIADSGRFMQAIKDGELEEVEPVGDWCVNMNSSVDFGEWRHDLPNKQK